MPDNGLQEVHRWLLSQGFTEVAIQAPCYAYEGILECNAVGVSIRLTFLDLKFLELPEIYLLNPRPKELARPLPHIDHHGKLCYLDQESYRIDPYDPVVTMATLLDQAKRVLISSLAGTNSHEVGHEFHAYWEADILGAMLSNERNSRTLKYNLLEFETPTGRSSGLLVIGTDGEIEAFRKQRDGTLKESVNKHALWIKVSETALLPEQGEWPPKHFKGLYEWIKKADPGAANRLHHMLGSKAGTHNPLLVIFNTKGGMVAFEVKLPKGMAAALESPGRFRKMILSDTGRFGTKVCRSSVDDLSQKFQTTRNLPGADLRNKHIVLIGCGTVGGYLARLLVQSGAGQGKAKLVIYDGQSLSSGNIGRHYLDAAYLYENKAIACQHKLLSEYPMAQINGVSQNFSRLENESKANIIIDATGFEAFSLSLNAQVVEKHKAKDTCPSVLFTWIDGSGYCTRTVYYDGTGGCYRCLLNADRTERFEPLLNPENAVPITYQCGESYTPYPPSVSVQAAGLALDAVLDWAQGRVKPQFRNRVLHQNARNHKDQQLTPAKGCPACQS